MAVRDNPDTGVGFEITEVLRLLLVLLLWLGAVWLWAPAVGVELPDIADARRWVGLVTDNPEPQVASARSATPPMATAGATMAGAQGEVDAARAAPPAAETAATQSAVLAPFCAPGKQPEFVLGFAQLKERLGATMGAPLECEHGDPNGTGDTLQQTSTGLAYYRQKTGAVMFTDGWNHWALVGTQLVEWEGESVDPPPGLVPGQ